MIQVINRAFDILELIAKEKTKIHSLTEIADGLGLNHGTCANIIKTMVQRNYLEQVGHKKGYKLGFMSYKIAGNHSYEQELLKVSVPEMEKLTAKLNETSLLAILKENIRVAIHQVNANHDLMVKSSTEKSAYNSASGRLLVAMLDDNRLRQFLEKYGYPSADFWQEASTEKTFKSEIAKIRKSGYATQTTKSHIVGIAVPIKKNEDIVASLSMYLPSSRNSDKVMRDIIVQLNKTCDIIGKKLSQHK